MAKRNRTSNKNKNHKHHHAKKQRIQYEVKETEKEPDISKEVVPVKVKKDPRVKRQFAMMNKTAGNTESKKKLRTNNDGNENITAVDTKARPSDASQTHVSMNTTVTGATELETTFGSSMTMADSRRNDTNDTMEEDGNGMSGGGDTLMADPSNEFSEEQQMDTDDSAQSPTLQHNDEVSGGYDLPVTNQTCCVVPCLHGFSTNPPNNIINCGIQGCTNIIHPTCVVSSWESPYSTLYVINTKERIDANKHVMCLSCSTNFIADFYPEQTPDIGGNDPRIVVDAYDVEVDNVFDGVANDIVDEEGKDDDSIHYSDDGREDVQFPG